jgi:hypothetical protein
LARQEAVPAFGIEWVRASHADAMALEGGLDVALERRLSWPAEAVRGLTKIAAGNEYHVASHDASFETSMVSIVGRGSRAEVHVIRVTLAARLSSDA